MQQRFKEVGGEEIGQGRGKLEWVDELKGDGSLAEGPPPWTECG